MRNKLTRLIKKLCLDFNADYEKVDSKTRKREIILVRHIVYFFVKEETSLSLTAIGSIFNQDHATALHAINNIQNLLDTSDISILEWYRLNEIYVRKLVDMAINGNGFLIKKKYRHYEIIEMVAKHFGETAAEGFEKFLIGDAIKRFEEIQ